MSDVSVVAAADAEREALTVADTDVAGVAGTGDIVVVEGAVSIASVSMVGSSCVVCGSLVGSSIDSRSLHEMLVEPSLEVVSRKFFACQVTWHIISFCLVKSSNGVFQVSVSYRGLLTISGTVNWGFIRYKSPRVLGRCGLKAPLTLPLELKHG